MGGDGDHYHFDQEIFSWCHEQPGGKSPTLRIARSVLEHNPAFAILYQLDRLNVARAIRANPEARLMVIEDGALITLKEIP
jgi:hypothetical protein